MKTSDTPRTDAAYSASTGAGIYELFKESQELERELAAANERIRRLIEAGDKLHWAFMHPFDPARYDLPKLWIEAKTKP